MGWTNRDEERLRRQSRQMASEAQRQWSKKNPWKSGCLTCFSLLFLGLLGLFIALGMMGAFDHLG